MVMFDRLRPQNRERAPYAAARASRLTRTRAWLSPFALACALATSCGVQDSEPPTAHVAPAADRPSATKTPSATNTPSATETGTLKLTVRIPDGKLWTGACSAFATPVAGGPEVLLSEGLQRGPNLEASLAGGRWRVRVDSEEPMLSCSAGSAPPFSAYGAAEAECEIRAHETTPLEIRLRAGGRLNLMIALPEGFKAVESEELSALPEEDRCTRALDIANAKTGNRCARVSVEPAASSPGHRVSFLAPGCSRLAADRVILGMTSKSEAFFDAGPLTLRIEAPGFEPVTVPLTIEAGHDTDLRVELKPLPVAK